MKAVRATICLLTYGPHLAYFRRALTSILRHTPCEQVELRLGFNEAPGSFHFALGRLCPDSSSLQLECGLDGQERAAFLHDSGMMVRLWHSPINLYKEPMCRHLYYDVPLLTEYVIWLDDDSHVQPGWWEALLPQLERKVDYLGQPWWVDYLPGQVEMIRAQPWYRGVPLAQRNGREGVAFFTGGFVVLRVERLYQANFPDVDFNWHGDTLKQFGGDTLLGEIAHQQGWSCAAHDQHVRINVDFQDRHPAPRRGGTGRQFGASVDVVIR